MFSIIAVVLAVVIGFFGGLHFGLKCMFVTVPLSFLMGWYGAALDEWWQGRNSNA
jgi:hypothetical protein